MEMNLNNDNIEDLSKDINSLVDRFWAFFLRFKTAVFNIFTLTPSDNIESICLQYGLSTTSKTK